MDYNSQQMPPDPVSHGAGEQSCERNRASTAVAHNAWLIGAKVVLSGFALLLGVQLFRLQSLWGVRLLGALIAAVSAWGLWLAILVGYRRVRTLRRRFTGRCVACGYEISGTSLSSCQECGGDVFEER